MDEAIERGREYLKSGADVIFIETPRWIEELKEIGSKINAPLVANMIEGGMTPNMTASDFITWASASVFFPSQVYSLQRLL